MATLEEQMLDFGDKLRRMSETRSLHVARKTAELMRIVVSSSRKSTAEELIEEIKTAGKELNKCQPLAFAVGNIIRRVLRFVRDERQIELGLQQDQQQVAASESAAGRDKQVPDLLGKHFGPRSPAFDCE